VIIVLIYRENTKIILTFNVIDDVENIFKCMCVGGRSTGIKGNASESQRRYIYTIYTNIT
jgi:hypothetical protein